MTGGPERREIGRLAFALSGILLFLLKYATDSVIAEVWFDTAWLPLAYLSGAVHPLLADSADGLAYALLWTAVPFIAIGVLLTVWRLRSIGASGWLALVFFVPFANLVFFVMLCLYPPATPRPDLASDISVQEDAAYAAALEAEEQAADGLPARGGTLPALKVFGRALLIVGPVGVALGWISIDVLGRYGSGLFLGVPFWIGFGVVALGDTRSYGAASRASASAVALSCALFLVLGFEGLFCILLAMPPAILLGLVGGWVAHALFGSNEAARARRRGRAIGGTLLTIAALLLAESAAERTAPLWRVTSGIDVAAPREVVWRNVVSFHEIAPPDEWLFRTGVAYPLRASIDGHGVGAVRRCEFTTGAFVEPIEVWDEPAVLRFGVREQPRPLHEWTPWGEIVAPHLDGCFRSERGEFRLDAIAGGGTRLTGTTWYRHDLAPSFYWRLWSDWIIHRIHVRVLRHIRQVAESE